ncbi:MAG: hypothetical protein COW01_08315 [Bdellovibrionales bacterium CG12_big_fil_rev_8_21_14_0_65_38_15]|nr:MAG: hypothetical protein COW79_16195 [Bdellovibrionales bacterium CG22_combo_CG10-13_8_21_14_all_38_13]PIQ55197.1 MAG: hypothetical protein COW01_08315 [Bdellovibrionales bacterium CG12_big_fil_rev_8_21_14_0_65_38_15]PIR28742.1 MAG: hypothetical protein COV38_14160 [Bdellovibrionales bacterium CG11_big_fil_rev_8_21_14_0_20_38_13]
MAILSMFLLKKALKEAGIIPDKNCTELRNHPHHTGAPRVTFKDLLPRKEFWNLLKSLESLENPTSLSSFANAHEVKPHLVCEVVSVLQKLNYPLVIDDHHGQDILVPPSHSPGIHFEMSLCEWLALQAMFPVIGKEESKPHYALVADKLEDLEAHYPEYDMYKLLEEEEAKEGILGRLGEQAVEMVKKIEDGLSRGLVVQVHWGQSRVTSVYPHKLVYLEGELSLVGEDAGDRCLVSFSVNDINSIRFDVTKNYQPNFSPIEVDDFILALRVVSGNEERLVLKLKTANDVDLNPPYHFLANPYITTNSEGDVIWAASVEVCDDFYAWLHDLGDRVQIMDPTHVATGYSEWLHRSSEIKKAS